MSKFLDFFKENKEIIILIPTLLGGLYQILNLLILVGMPYVRYFSVSQVIPDGLLISIAIFWVYLVLKIILSLYKDLNTKGDKEKKHNFLFNTIYISLFCSLGVFFIYSVSLSDDFSSFGAIILRYATYVGGGMFIWFGIKHLLFISDLDDWLSTRIKELNTEIKDFIIKILIILAFGLFVRIFLNEISVINEMFIKVSNFENYTSFSTDIQNSYGMKSEPILLYINRDYAFFKIPDSEGKILVVDAKKLTEIKEIP